MRTFVRLREMLLSNAELARKLAALENKYDAQFKVVFDAIRELMLPRSAPAENRFSSSEQMIPNNRFPITNPPMDGFAAANNQ